MIDKKLIMKFQEKYNSDKCNKSVEAAVAQVGIRLASLNRDALKRHNFMFSETTKKGQVTEQNASGRCWMFAALNTARVDTMKKYNLSSTEFSQAYTLFWDKLERSNYFLNAIIETVDEATDSRLITHLLSHPLDDGGQWDMFSGILNKYGIVPKDHMQESYNSSNTYELNSILISMLRYFAFELRDTYAKTKNLETLKDLKEKYLYSIYNILVKALGQVPEYVEYEYEDKDGKYHRLPKMTPVEFFKEVVGWNLDDKISLINAPTSNKPYNHLFSIKYLGNIVEGKKVKHLNVEIDKLKAAAIKAIKNGDPVWFGCDVGKMSYSKLGIMDHKMFNYEEVLGYIPKWTKTQRLEYGESLLTHAMVFTGVNLDKNGNPINWQVENSWGEKIGKNGVFSMSDEWFDEFTYQIMIDKKYLPKELVDIYENDQVIELEPWDPMGALAK
ncbi:aminopeptidase C [Metamycoplasma equirhinis]|uniref:Aminopeptidase n=1 Tax=Metamycoplasma equirhinis TaxID=92402 RepID=A0ABZ0PB68_9BACT|nr:C1 family peptidase [Metamycoplasma equirhinis]TPD99422.1 C1 family peptidase [Metamycoplasma equirhinis]WPB53834.1 C1 family peptidase [Metamycoplasma equirhinis]